MKMNRNNSYRAGETVSSSSLTGVHATALSGISAAVHAEEIRRFLCPASSCFRKHPLRRQNTGPNTRKMECGNRYVWIAPEQVPFLVASLSPDVVKNQALQSNNGLFKSQATLLCNHTLICLGEPVKKDLWVSRITEREERRGEGERVDRILDLSSETDAERKAQDALFGCDHHHLPRKISPM
ncbi:Hypothetical predicted protein [Xyrichtys novacula]|uniref:Uncharacterized protein n=1 Tax=Xyrichtys novacula TaxID=13765 RepID=A0AAV1G4J2_XYRNO|nr:Hypothetical predicted protein [Xyrichtys novacula]